MKLDSNKLSVKCKILRRTVTFLCVAAVALLFYALNRLTPLYADDYSYTRNFMTKESIASLADICRSMGIHYMKVNGRIVVHFLAQLFLWWGKPVFNVVNTAAFLALGTLMYLAAAGTPGGFKLTRWLLGLLGVWLLAPGFGQSCLWLTGASNYLFGILIVLAFLVTYRVGVSFTDRKRLYAFTLLFFAAGVVAGWTNENTGTALIAAAVCFVVKNKIETGRYSLWMCSGLIGAVTGFLFMVLAPGQTARLSAYDTVTPALLLGRALGITKSFIGYLWPAILIFVFLLAAHLLKRAPNRWKSLANTGIFTLASLVSAYSMAVAPYFPERAWSGTVVFGTIALVSLLNTALSDFRLGVKHAAVIKSFIITGLAIVFIFTYANAYAAVKEASIADRERMASAGRQIAEGIPDIILPAVSSRSKYSCFEPAGDLSSDESYWVNFAMARYLGVDTVTKEGS